MTGTPRSGSCAGGLWWRRPGGRCCSPARSSPPTCAPWTSAGQTARWPTKSTTRSRPGSAAASPVRNAPAGSPPSPAGIGTASGTGLGSGPSSAASRRGPHWSVRPGRRRATLIGPNGWRACQRSSLGRAGTTRGRAARRAAQPRGGGRRGACALLVSEAWLRTDKAAAGVITAARERPNARASRATCPGSPGKTWTSSAGGTRNHPNGPTWRPRLTAGWWPSYCAAPVPVPCRRRPACARSA